jgi:hypothetical protein
MRIETEGTFQGIEFRVAMNPLLGARCGYIRVPEGHPWYEKSFMDIDVEVHGGLTFSGFSEILGDGFWVGFDCAHASDGFCFDEMDHLKIFEGLENYIPRDGKIRTKLYVESQCKKLASFCLDVVKEMQSGES